MTSKINFENFKNGDKVIITISNKNGEEIYPCRITNIFPVKKLIHFEDNKSEYECKFSEVTSIVRTRTVYNYGRWILLCIIVLLILVIVLDNYFLKLNKYVYRILAYDIPSVLIFLDICYYLKIKKDKLNAYEKQNNAPYTLSVFTCALIYPALMWMSIMLGPLAFLLLPTCLLGWLPGHLFFREDQIKLYQYRENHLCRKKIWIRMIEFLIFYPFFIYVGYAMLGMLF